MRRSAFQAFSGTGTRLGESISTTTPPPITTLPAEITFNVLDRLPCAQVGRIAATSRVMRDAASSHQQACVGVDRALSAIGDDVRRYIALWLSVAMMNATYGYVQVTIRSAHTRDTDGVTSAFVSEESNNVVHSLSTNPIVSSYRTHTFIIRTWDGIQLDPPRDILPATTTQQTLPADLVDALTRMVAPLRDGGERVLTFFNVEPRESDADAWFTSFIAWIGDLDHNDSDQDVIFDVLAGMGRVFVFFAARDRDVRDLGAFHDTLARFAAGAARVVPLEWATPEPDAPVDGALVLKLALVAHLVAASQAWSVLQSEPSHRARYDTLVALVDVVARDYGLGSLTWIDDTLDRLRTLIRGLNVSVSDDDDDGTSQLQPAVRSLGSVTRAIIDSESRLARRLYSELLRRQ